MLPLSLWPLLSEPVPRARKMMPPLSALRLYQSPSSALEAAPPPPLQPAAPPPPSARRASRMAARAGEAATAGRERAGGTADGRE